MLKDGGLKPQGDFEGCEFGGECFPGLNAAFNATARIGYHPGGVKKNVLHLRCKGVRNFHSQCQLLLKRLQEQDAQ